MGFARMPADAALVAVATTTLLVGVYSPSAVATPPNSVLAIAQIFCIPLRTPEPSDVFRYSVWFVCSKLIRFVSLKHTCLKAKHYSPVDTLRISRLKLIRACTSVFRDQSNGCT